jgi:hypothetical protein
MHDPPNPAILGGASVNRTFEHFSPHPAHLVQMRGWIGIGYNDYGYSFVRALNIGGMIWEGLEHYPMLDKALQALECALGEWRRAQGFT